MRKVLFKVRLKMSTHPIIVISGFSGAGKSFHGKRLARERGWYYLDLDDFYKSKKPDVTLSNGRKVKNWDCLEALDIHAFQKRIEEMKKLPNFRGLVITGFALRTDVLGISPDLHLHLSIDKETSIVRRKHKFRNYSRKKFEMEKKILDEVAYPFYLETLQKSKIDHFIDGTGQPEEIYQEILSFI